MRNGDILAPELMVRRDDWSAGVSVYMRQCTVGFGSQVAAPITMIDHKQGTHAEPMFRLEIRQAQQLMDELWQCGLRPSEGSGSAGSLAATERHLKDMQSIAMGILRKEGIQV